jgi:hypothetical protein
MGGQIHNESVVTQHYVGIEGLDLNILESFFGFQILVDEDEFALIIDDKGNLQIIDKKRPHIYLEDINDAMLIRSRVIAVRDGSI